MPAKVTSDKDFVKKAYAAGVPMGQDMPPHRRHISNFLYHAHARG